jgi:hypothetical protein
MSFRVIVKAAFRPPAAAPSTAGFSPQTQGVQTQMPGQRRSAKIGDIHYWADKDNPGQKIPMQKKGPNRWEPVRKRGEGTVDDEFNKDTISGEPGAEQQAEVVSNQEQQQRAEMALQILKEDQARDLIRESRRREEQLRGEAGEDSLEAKYKIDERIGMHADHAFQEYQDRDQDSWMVWADDALSEGEKAMEWLMGPEGNEAMKKAFSFGPYEAAHISAGNKRKGGTFDLSMAFGNDEGRPVTLGCDRSFVDDPFDGFIFYNSRTTLHPEFGRIDFSPQLYIRQEDFWRNLTQDFSEREKANVKVEVQASGDIGKYYWVVQGYRYATPESRNLHLNSLMRSLRDLGGLDQNGNRRKLPGHVLDEKGNDASIYDLGYSTGDVRELHERLKLELAMAMNKEVAEDEKLEPWELLSFGPQKEAGVFMRKNMFSPELLSCSLIKHMIIQEEGSAWDARMHVHGPTQRDIEGIEIGDRHRASSAYVAKKQGRSWGILAASESE